MLRRLGGGGSIAVDAVPPPATDFLAQATADGRGVGMLGATKSRAWAARGMQATAATAASARLQCTEVHATGQPQHNSPNAISAGQVPFLATPMISKPPTSCTRSASMSRLDGAAGRMKRRPKSRPGRRPGWSSSSCRRPALSPQRVRRTSANDPQLLAPADDIGAGQKAEPVDGQHLSTTRG